MKKPGAWSFSSIKLYDTCPRKYEAEKITKEVVFTDTTATIYGKELHTAAEEYVRDDTVLPPKFEHIRSFLDKLKNFPGDKHCELKMGIKKEDGKFVACDFFDKDVWFRGIADLIIINNSTGWVLDYKTGKSSKYADIKQLALMAACMFAKYPQLEKVKAMLWFIVPNDIIQSIYTRNEAFTIFADLHGILSQREASYETGVFNPKPNGLCSKWCEALSCEHNGRNK